MRGVGVDEIKQKMNNEDGILSACYTTHDKAREASLKWYETRKARCVGFTESINNNQCSGKGDNATQVACLEAVQKNAKKAKDIQTELAGLLKEAQKNIAAAKAASEEAKRAYEADKEALAAKQPEAVAKSMEVPPPARDSTVKSVLATAVPRENLGATAVTDYKQSLPTLIEEQAAAVRRASDVSSAASGQIQYYERSNKELDSTISSLQQQIDYMKNPVLPKPRPSDISGGPETKLPETGPIPPERPKVLENAATPAPGTPATTSGDPVASTSDGGASRTSSSSPAGAMNSMAPMAAAAGGMAQQSPPGAAGAFQSLPGSTSPVDTGGQQVAAAQATPVKRASSLLAQKAAAKAEEVAAADAKESGKIAIDAGSPEVLVDAGGRTISGASANPALEGLKGAASGGGRTTASTNGGPGGSGGRFGFPEEGKGRLGEGFSGFRKDLDRGAINIAGSDVNSTLASFSSELGDLGIDVEKGQLTDEEARALAPMGEFGDAGSFEDGSLKEAAAGKDDNLGLFVRTRFAHWRAVKRGQLILGIKNKL